VWSMALIDEANLAAQHRKAGKTGDRREVPLQF
jgi:hypothetical protein